MGNKVHNISLEKAAEIIVKALDSTENFCRITQSTYKKKGYIKISIQEVILKKYYGSRYSRYVDFGKPLLLKVKSDKWVNC